MPSYTNPTDTVTRVVLKPRITRAFWSKRRAWHGDAVTLFIETELVPDGTPVKITIWEDDSAEGSPDDYIAEVEGSHQVQGNRYSVDYTLNWDEESLGEELELEGDEMEFVFKVEIEKFRLEKKSTLLYVDLHGFELSS